MGLALTDAACLLVALLAIRLVLSGFGAIPAPILVLIAVAPLPWVMVFRAFSLYTPERLPPAEEFRRVLGASALGMIAVVLAGYWWGIPLSRLWVGLAWVLVMLLEMGSRRVWRWHLGRLQTDGRLALRTMIVGTNEEAMHLARTLRSPERGFAPLGYISTTPSSHSPDGLPVVGQLSHVDEAIREHRAECLFAASTALNVEAMHIVAKAARRAGIQLRVSANVPEVLSRRLTVQPIGGVMALTMNPVRITGPQAVAKRALDLILSTLALVVFLPAGLVIGALVKLTSEGSVFYRQERAGRHGRRFTIYKFRTMVEGADEMRDRLLDRNEASGPLFKIRDDPRVTGVGRWLRRWSLDEVPQLINVVRGDMSLVGPRPALPRELLGYRDWHLDRLEVRPGLTGLWQVSGRSALSFDDYVRLDLFYIENWSLAYDLYILLKTIPVVLGRNGAY